jgi:hypothetical protein
MKEQNLSKKVQIWQVMVLVELVMVLFLGLYANYQAKAIAAQGVYMSQVEKLLGDKEKREKELSTRLTTVVTLLQRAVNDLNQGQPAAVINNVPVPAPAVAK